LAFGIPKRDEGPLLLICYRFKGRAKGDRERVARFPQCQGRQMVDARRRRFLAEIPHTATGKIQKVLLRERFKNYALPSADPVS